ncbi:3-isopropylmalate dehydratase small subunit [Thermomicrobium sp.]|uniref:3-isopropylmalate dehydratase small subunit n=1 Tax=Thermomicrobium roseum (strain ATCC 27502 / DSM 5159 / P-2) TaxID=309801 RepID=B9L0Y2_THERP|nr:3-isopropylmalate dehydratase, small subunit [Thermomicrobium roseum DSM 5159]
MPMRGRVWKFGDNIDTDVIIPARYLVTIDPQELAQHVMEDIDPEFASKVQPGDIIVAGRNFGCGSSREHAPIAIKAAGVQAVVAESFARIFFRNAINIGLPVVEAPEAVRETETGDELEIDTENGIVRNLRTGKTYKATQYDAFIQHIIRAGGLLNAVRERLAAQQAAGGSQ